MTASVHFITPRKPKRRLKTPSDKLSKRQLVVKLIRIEKAQAKKGKKP